MHHNQSTMKFFLPCFLFAVADAFTASSVPTRKTSLKAATLVEEEVDFDGTSVES